MIENKAYTIKNLITGHTYKLYKEDVDSLIIAEPYNFAVIDEDYIAPAKEDMTDLSTYKKIVVENDTPNEADFREGAVSQSDPARKVEQNRTFARARIIQELNDYSYDELKKYCKDNNLNTSGKKAELLERALEHNKTGV